MPNCILRHSDGREFSRLVGNWTIYSSSWDAIAEATVHEFECSIDDVGSEEGPDGTDLLTVRGDVVGIIDPILRAVVPVVQFVSEAAE